MTGENKTVLIVDDVSFNRKLIANHLAAEGFDCHEADSGEAAIQMATFSEFDVILMDVNLPGISGIEATQKIRSNDKSGSQRARIIGISAHASARDRQSFLHAGMDDCLPKPIDLSALVGVIGNHLQTEVGKHVDSKTKSQADVLDTEAALARIGSNLDLYRRFVSLFREDIRPLIESGKLSAEAGDLQQLGKIAHRIRGMSANLAANAVSEMAKRLEHSCESNFQDQVVRDFENLLEQLEILETEFVSRKLVAD